jgi:hypothetical protein
VNITAVASVERLDAATLTDAEAADLAVVEHAANVADSPHVPALGARQLQLRHRYGWEGHPTDHLFLARVDGVPVGYAALSFTHWDNPELASLTVVPHPVARTSDAVTDTLLQHAVEACQAAGRSQVISDAWQDSWLAAYWERHEWPVGSRAAQRRIVVGDLDRARLALLIAEAEQKSPGYDVEVLPLPTPEPLIEGLLEVHRAMNDAPLDDLVLDDDEWSQERLVAAETSVAKREMRLHRLIARRRSDGAVAGWTEVAVDPAEPTLGHQEDTSVVRAHRGHRLGLRLKATMLQRLAEVEPQLENIDTWNAVSNTHMIAVNEQLGCVVVGHALEVQRKLG